MKIEGFQKLTLLDFPGKTAATVFTGGCNFRCPFCHNALLVLPEEQPAPFEEEEIFAYLRRRRGVLDGVVVTGGEPLLQSDIVVFLAKLKDLGFLVKLDTNGSNPARLKELLDAGLADYVAMDIKNAPSAYAKTVGMPGVDIGAIAASRDILMTGKVDFEFRTTLVRGLHTEDSVREMAQFIAGGEKYYLQQFKNSGNLIAPDGLSAFTGEEMQKFAAICRTFVPATEIRGL